MPIDPEEIIAYASANHPMDDESTAGGAMDNNTRVVFTPLAATDDIEVLSSESGDTTQDVTVIARAANGSIVSDTKTLTGTSPVAFTFGTSGEAVERILRITMDGDATGTVTVRRGSGGDDIAEIPPGERGVTALFAGSFSDPSNPKTYYEKFFIYNSDDSLALLDAVVSEQADPEALFTFALSDTFDDTETITDRLTAPVDVTAFDGDPTTVDDAVGVPDLPEETAIGVWVKMDLGADEAAVNSSYSLRLSGNDV